MTDNKTHQLPLADAFDPFESDFQFQNFPLVHQRSDSFQGCEEPPVNLDNHSQFDLEAFNNKYD